MKVSVTICMESCRCVLVREAGLDRGDGAVVGEHFFSVALFCGCCRIPASFSLGSRPFVLEALGDFRVGMLKKPVGF